MTLACCCSRPCDENERALLLEDQHSPGPGHLLMRKREAAQHASTGGICRPCQSSIHAVCCVMLCTAVQRHYCCGSQLSPAPARPAKLTHQTCTGCKHPDQLTAQLRFCRGLIRVIDQLLIADVLMSYKASFKDDLELLLRLRRHHVATQQQAGNTALAEPDAEELAAEDLAEMLLTPFPSVCRLRVELGSVVHSHRVQARLLLFDYQCLVNKVMQRLCSTTSKRAAGCMGPCASAALWLLLVGCQNLKVREPLLSRLPTFKCTPWLAPLMLSRSHSHCCWPPPYGLALPFSTEPVHSSVYPLSICCMSLCAGAGAAPAASTGQAGTAADHSSPPGHAVPC